ncbi:amidohydrolase family protein [Candidatus Bipolaricaulota bacterium]
MKKVVRAGSVFDPRTGKAREKHSLVLEGERVEWIGPDDKLPSVQAAEIDLSDLHVFPGLIDCHSHAVIRPREGDQAGQLHLAVVEQTLRTIDNMKRDILSGVTTARLCGVGDVDPIEKFLQMYIDKGEILGPRTLISLWPLSSSYGHGGNPVRVDGVEEIRKTVRRTIKQGAEFVKIFLNPRDHDTTWSFEEVETAVVEAHRVHIPVCAHAVGDHAVQVAVKAGVDTIEHLGPVSESTVKQVAEAGIAVVFTSTIVFHPEKGLEAVDARDNPAMMSYLEARRSSTPATYKWAQKHGVNYSFGTDACRGMLAYELKVAVDFGCTPVDVLTRATKVAAEILNMSDRVGTLEPGKYADIVAFRENPLEDITVVSKPAFVMKGGDIVLQT